MPLVSILIPAHNAANWIADSIQSGLGQTWQQKEVIVVDDGSTDQTLAIARRFESKSVRVITQENQGAAAARNRGLAFSQGDYIQYLDADDLLAPNKIERQLSALRQATRKRILLSSTWAPFYYRPSPARFVHNSLCQNLSPVEWLLRKMGENLYMQTATWLTSRELAEAAGPWDTRLLSDDDVEYFCRVLLASEGTRFVPGTGSFYRITSSNRLSYIGNSDAKKDALLISTKLLVSYLSSMENSERVRNASLAYMQSTCGHFYPERPDLIAELQHMAVQFHGCLKVPQLPWKYSWMEPVFGPAAAKCAQTALPRLRDLFLQHLDKTFYKLMPNRAAGNGSTAV